MNPSEGDEERRGALVVSLIFTAEEPLFQNFLCFHVFFLLLY